MYSAYGDESYDETKQRVFAVAGLFGAKSDWADLCRKWQERTGRTPFHASECETDQGDYKHTGHRENQKLYADLSRILGDSKLIGAAAAVDIPAYKEILAPRLEENPYYMCFYFVIGALGMDSAVCIPRDIVKFVFDRNHEIEFNAGQLYDFFMNNDKDASMEYKQYMHDEIGFATRRTIGIQAADLLAREAMKRMDNFYGPTYRAERGSYTAVRKNKGIRIRYYNRAKLQEIAQFVINDGGIYQKQEYMDWLKRNNLKGDNLPRKLRFLIERREGTDED
jgi:hypothetical protein